ncbi:hypothetical protein J4E83_009105 [Alternaria metachromatica]|uniref:uncharacterized protein n=1 Tax=Alternaria metachromatica TaxID=283354 RepID=UPI0020C3618E|nr:uncharacterized protein J4E83_009105 [Alternaria metachromatica]KAI4608303.1 hypothetical protein J4E83_009105 [Alternaria metachromatica]
MAPLSLVYFVINGIYMLQLDKTTYISEDPEIHAPAQFKSYIVLGVACVVACALLSVCLASFGGRKRAEEYARQKTMSGDVRQRDDGGMEWFNIDLLKDDVDLGDEEVQRFHFFDVDDEIGDISLKSGSREDNIGKKSSGSASGFG